MKVVIYHNPRCSKSRQTLQLLQDNGAEPEVIEYLKTPPDKTRLKQILGLLDMQPRDLMRQKDAPYKELNLADDNLKKDELITAMVETPGLIERPIVVVDDKKARIGRPPESVLDLL